MLVTFASSFDHLCSEPSNLPYRQIQINYSKCILNLAKSLSSLFKFAGPT